MRKQCLRGNRVDFSDNRTYVGKKSFIVVLFVKVCLSCENVCKKDLSKFNQLCMLVSAAEFMIKGWRFWAVKFAFPCQSSCMYACVCVCVSVRLVDIVVGELTSYPKGLRYGITTEDNSSNGDITQTELLPFSST